MRLFDVNDRASSSRQAVPVRVNGIEITPADIAREIQNHPAETPGAAKEMAVRALAVRELLLQEARRIGIPKQPEADADGRRESCEEALIRGLIEAGINVPSPNEQECRRFYEANLDRFRSPGIYEAAHILFAAPRSDRPAYTAADRLARETIDVLLSEPDRFAELARDLSACPSGKVGGNLGQISTGQTTPDFESALVRMPPGTMSAEPVLTPYGAHVVKLDRCIEGATLPFDAVRGEIADYLSDAVFHRAVHQYISILAGRAEIEGVELEKSDGGLVQ